MLGHEDMTGDCSYWRALGNSASEMTPGLDMVTGLDIVSSQHFHSFLLARIRTPTDISFDPNRSLHQVEYCEKLLDFYQDIEPATVTLRHRTRVPKFFTSRVRPRNTSFTAPWFSHPLHTCSFSGAALTNRSHSWTQLHALLTSVPH